MARSQHTEVPTVQRRKLGLIETFHYRQHGGIHEPNVGIRVTVAQSPNPLVVLRV